jgi:hypothetical protein
MELKRIYNFSFDYDKKDLLERIERNFSLMNHSYNEAKDNNLGGQDCWRIELQDNLDNDDMKYIYDVCKPIIETFNSKNHPIRLQYYKPGNYLGWHYDAPLNSGITKVNLLLTDQKAFEDKEGNEYEFGHACIVNATTFEHRYINHSDKPRCFIRIGLQDVLFSDAVATLEKINWRIDANKY